MNGDYHRDLSQAGTRPVVRQSGGHLPQVMLGLLATVAFYAAAPRIPGTEIFVQRYFCGHPLEYVSTTLFFCAAAILLGKMIRLPRERRAVRLAEMLAADLPRNDRLNDLLLTGLERETPRGIQGTALFRRLIDTQQYVHTAKDSRFEDHLRYLADLAADRLHQSFALLRTIAWAIPIVGFLGTVIGITIAIANVTPEQLESSLPEVTAGLAVAFDTTAQALGMSIVLVLATFLVERGEQLVLNDVERFGIDCLLPACLSARASRDAAADADGPRELSRRMLDQQAELWTDQLRQLRQEWGRILQEQSAGLMESLTSDTESVLASWRDDLTEAGREHRQRLTAESSALAERLDSVVTQFTTRVELWQQALQTTSVSAAGQTEELHRLGRTLLQLAESEERLAGLQQQLNDNLERLQIVETLEQTLNGLNAAVNVLTAKTVRRAA